MTFFAQQDDDLVVVMVESELSNALNESLGITDDVGPVAREIKLQGFGLTALPTNVQSDDLRLRSLHDGDVAHQQTQNALAIARRGRRGRPQSREVFRQLEDLPFLLSGNGPH